MRAELDLLLTHFTEAAFDTDTLKEAVGHNQSARVAIVSKIH